MPGRLGQSGGSRGVIEGGEGQGTPQDSDSEPGNKWWVSGSKLWGELW